MKLQFEIEPSDVAKVRAFFTKYEASPLVQIRKERNIDGRRGGLSEAAVWTSLVSSLLTTQQQSGPDSPVTRFLRVKPFPLRLEEVRSRQRTERWIETTLRSWGGIRRYNHIAREISVNLRGLDGGRWVETLSVISALEQAHVKEDERRVAHFLDEELAGVGPKQARNTLQSLGLTQYEVPLDSRVAKWLRKFGFPMPVSAAMLADTESYDFVMDRFQEIAEAADIVPCLLDAVIFASFDREWTREAVVY